MLPVLQLQCKRFENQKLSPDGTGIDMVAGNN